MFRILSLLCLVPFFSFATITVDDDSDFVISSFETPAFITSFEECYVDIKKTQVVIKLNDGSHWFVKKSEQRVTPEELASQILQNWQAGDDIRIDHNSGNNFVLKNLYSNVPYFASLDLARVESPISLKQIDQSGYVILTNENSEWVTGWFGSMIISKWRPGDALTINKSDFSDEVGYLIINRRDGTSCWLSLVIWK